MEASEHHLEQENHKESEVLQVPPEAESYFPPEDSVFFIFSNGEKHRRIFGEPQMYEPDEEKALEEFANYLNSKSLALPAGCSMRDAYKHLIVLEDPAKTYESILSQHNFFKNIRPVSTAGIEGLLQSGLFYFCNRDKNFRPIWVLDLKKFVELQFTDEELTRCTVIMFDYVCNKCMVPGKIENFIVFVDARDVGATQIPRKRIKPLIDTMKTCYRGRLYKFFGLHVSMTLRVIWKLVKGFMDKSTQKQMEIYGGTYTKDLLKFIDEDKLEEKFGGRFANKTSDYFPPNLG